MSLKISNTKLAAVIAGLLGTASFNSFAADTASYDLNTQILSLPAIEVLDGSKASYNAELQFANGEFVLTSLQPANGISGHRNTYDPSTTAVHIPAISVAGTEYYARLRYIPNSNPTRFKIDQLANNAFEGCPDFATAGPVEGSCILSGEYNKDITLTSNTQWILSGGVYIGGDKKNSATLTIDPGTHVFGQQGADFLWIRRDSKIMSEGTPDSPVVMSGPLQESAGEWGGLVISGNAPVNGCNEGVELCEIPFEAITSEIFGGNQPEDSSGVLKYTQILFAGFAVRPNEELNGLTLNAVGSGTLIDYVQVHAGLDDGVEMFGGTAQMKHMVLTGINDDSLDWGLGWTGKAQHILIQQAADDGDRGIEADNNGDNPDIQPRSQPTLANMTLIGSAAGSQGALLRRGTGANIWNSVFSGFGSDCLRIDGEATYQAAGTPGALSGLLTIAHSFVDCASNFADEPGAAFLTSEWFNSQMGNSTDDPKLNGYLPGAGSPLPTSGMMVSDPFFDKVTYVGAFKDSDSDWSEEWTFNF